MNTAVHEDVATLRTLHEAVEQASVGRVFGTPITQDGVTVVPVAKIGGGGGAGEDEASGSGGGFGLAARPLGVFVIRGGKVRWQPAIDVNKVILGGQLVAVVALLAGRAFARYRAGRGRRA